MEPIKINIEVNLGEATLAALDRLLTAGHSAPAEAPAAPQATVPAPAPKKTKKAAEMPQPEPQPQPQGEDPEGTGAEDVVEDLPPDDAPDPQPKKAAPAPTEADARQAVKSARDRGVSAKVIREYMQTSFGIASSVECPEDRRQELIDGLAKLAA
jgi:outer membrane biosynthesis protein TonB